MIPVQDIIPTRSGPVATMTLIALNLAAFSVQRWSGQLIETTSVLSLLWTVFRHHDVLLLLVNLLFLWLFGDNVEDQLGRVRFALLYVLSGVSAAVAQILMMPNTRELLVGASGAIGGILGAYFLLYPRSRVLMFFPVPPTLHEVPAVMFLGFWFTLQVLAIAAQTSPAATTTNVVPALFAHVVGFGTGMFLCLTLRRPERARVEWWGP